MGLHEGKTIVITGAARGVGRVLTRHFVAEGAEVIAIGRSRATLEAAAATGNGKIHAFPANISIAADVEAVFDAIGARFTKIDAIINNAAAYDFFRVDEGTPDQMAEIVNANLLGPMLTTRYGTPLLRAAGGGDIINISSETVRNPYSFLAAYAASKAGLENLARGLRAELKRYGIRVMTLQIGQTSNDERHITASTEILQQFITDNQAAMSASSASMDPQVVAQAISAMMTLPREASFEMVELRAL